VYHRLTQVAHWEYLLLVFALIAFRQGLDINGGGFLQLLHTCDLSIGEGPWQKGVEYKPSCRSVISISKALNSSDTPVLASWPIFSPAHCLTRSSFLLIFIVVVVVVVVVVALVHGKGVWFSRGFMQLSKSREPVFSRRNCVKNREICGVRNIVVVGCREQQATNLNLARGQGRQP